MYLRCSSCHQSTWIRSLVPGMVEGSVACSDCGKDHSLARADELGVTGKQQYETANAFAANNGVDLPTAYSVLLGLITLREAREVDSREKEKKRQGTAQARLPQPDPVFSPKPARRKVRASRPRTQRAAQQDAESNHVTIHVEREMARERRRLTLPQGVILAILAALVLGLSGRHAHHTWARLVAEGRRAQQNTAASAKVVAKADQQSLHDAVNERPAKPDALDAEVRRNQAGDVVQVLGHNPQAVLDAYCAAISDTFEREPLGLTQGSGASQRFGVFRDLSSLEHDFVISIRRDSATRRWVVGNGSTRIVARAVPIDTEIVRSAALNP